MAIFGGQQSTVGGQHVEKFFQLAIVVSKHKKMKNVLWGKEHTNEEKKKNRKYVTGRR